ncbi:hypothetical protein [Croceicoccus gelatinilyticus]|uniref:hypothetical protein n=1 Tax=Croceicoccus gelatinilyticus TaxID=2835536 RepID=UPI001BCCAF74|nr:hypothetical protein [Croceicoccus gelatinilyticus]MBS7668290.1 hypothetical protein [Croceicoccus gelatinilyticus]
MTPSDDVPALSETQRNTIARKAMRRTWLLMGSAVAATGLGLASCVPPAPEPVSAPPPAPAPAPAPAPTPTPTPPPVSEAPSGWLDAPLTAGDWQYVSSGTATRAVFGEANGDAKFILACEPANRQVKLWRAGTGPGATSMHITSTEADRTLPAGAVTTPSAYTVATLQPYDPILDAMIFSRGRVAVQVPGLSALYLPSWPEIARVVEDCR